MKTKFKKILLLMLVAFVFPKVIFASGGMSVSKTNISLKVGESATFDITATNAAGRVDILLSNSSVAKAVIKGSEYSDTADFLDKNSTTVTVTGVKAGTTQITVATDDMTTYDKEEITTSYVINVTVTEPEKPVSNDNNNSKKSSSEKKYSNNKSSNTGLKELEVEGYKVVKKDEDSYELKVKSTVNKIKINAITQDSKAKVTGTGEQKLLEGKNNIDIIVTAEDGTTKTYKLIVTKEKINYYLKDINDFVDSDSNTLLLKDNDTLTNDMINKLKNLNRDIKLVNDSYSLSMNTNDLKDSFNTDIKSSVDNEGLNLILDENIPIGTKLKYDVSNQFSNNKKVSIYKYVNDELVLVDTCVVSNGNIEFELDGSSKYLILSDDKKDVTDEAANLDKKGVKIWFIIPIVLLLIVGIIIFLKRKKDKK